MTEEFPHDPLDQPASTISPRTAFVLTKTGQMLVGEVIEHTDPIVRAELETEVRSTVFYSSENKCFGDLAEWDGQYFSYVRKATENSNPDDHLIQFDTHPESFIQAPGGLVLGVTFGFGGASTDKEVVRSEVAFRSEGTPVVRNWVQDSERANGLRIDEWRDMTEDEGQHLLADFGELGSRLRSYITEHPDAVLFSDSDYRE